MKVVRRLRLWVSLALLAVVAAGARATDYYVATDGDDTNAGTLEKPFKSPVIAAKKLQPGDTLYFRAGTYKCRTDGIIALAPSRSGEEKAPIVFKNYNDEHVVLDVAGTDWGLSNNGHSWIVFDGFEVVGGTTHCMKLGMSHPGSRMSGHHVTVRNCAMRGAGESANIFCFKTPNLLIENCHLHSAKKSHGLYVNQGCHNSVFRNITSENNHGNSGMQFNAGGGTVTNVLVENCILRHNAQGFSLIRCLDSVFRNNVVINNGYKGPRNSGWREIILTACTGNLIENNTFVNTLPPNHVILHLVDSQANSQTNTFRNNLFAVKTKPVFRLAGFAGYVFENNCLFNMGGGQQVEKEGALSNFCKAKSLQESGNIAADPLFVDLAKGDVQLKEGSPCIDAGVKTAASTPVVGKARDIGALEFGGKMELGCRLPWKK